jgi:TrmH family RNA methyltransferase
VENKSFLKIILVKPRNPVNIGAAARVMANFGLTDLRLVAPYQPILKETIETADTITSEEPSFIREKDNTAVGAGDIIKKAKIFETLKEASSDCVLALATSSLKKRNPDRDIVSLKDVSNYISENQYEGNIGFVFGSEKTGLTVKDLSYCNAIINIPTKKLQPSINLAQSVAIVCYEIAGRNEAIKVKSRKTRKPSLEEINSVVSLIKKKMERDGISHGDWIEEKTRKGFLDANLNKAILNTIKKILNKDK